MGATIKVGDLAHLRAVTPDYYIHTFRGLPNISFRFKRTGKAEKAWTDQGLPLVGPDNPNKPKDEYIDIPFVLDRKFRTSAAAKDNTLHSHNAAILRALKELVEKSYFIEHFGEGWELVLRGAHGVLGTTSPIVMNKLTVGVVTAGNMLNGEVTEQMNLFDTKKIAPHREDKKLKTFLQLSLGRNAFLETLVRDNSNNRSIWGPAKVTGVVNVFDEDFRFIIGHPYYAIKGVIAREEIIRCVHQELEQNFPWILRRDLFRDMRFDD
jgi:hypothetical protein